MENEFHELVKSSFRSLVRTNAESVVDAALQQGKGRPENREFYIRAFADTTRSLRTLDSLLPSVQPSSGEISVVVERLKEIKSTVHNIKKGKQSPSLIATLRDDLKIIVISLKQKDLDKKIESFDLALSKVLGAEAAASNALAKVEKVRSKVHAFEEEVKQLAEANRQTTNQINSLARAAKYRREKVGSIEAEAGERLKSIQSTEDATVASSRSVNAIREQLNQLTENVNAHVSEMRRVQAETIESVSSYDAQKDEFLMRLEGIEAEANSILLTATAGGLFDAYEVRRKEIARNVKSLGGKLNWAIATAITGTSVIWIVSEFNRWPITEQVIAKVTIVTFFIFVVWFYTYQYNRERILEEEYAYRANMSASYPAFRSELLKLASDDATLKAKAVDAAIGLTQEIFTDPLDDIKRKRGNRKEVDEAPKRVSSDELVADITKRVGDVLGAATDLIQKAGKAASISPKE